VINKFGVQGSFEILVNGKLEAKINNRVMNDVLDQMAELYQGNAADLEIKYLALGTDNTPVTDTDATLGNEIFRTPIVSQSKVGTGEILTEFIVLDTEAVGNIEEIGIFGGTGATASADSGALISRILWSKVKSNSEEITFRRTDKVVRG
jgi:hypothetical protein